MKERIGKFIKNGISPERRLELQMVLVTVLSLATITVMSGYMDRYGAEKETDGWAAVSTENGRTAASEGVSGIQSGAQEGIIRFHVIANSDSEADQELKLQVRNHVLAKVQTHLRDEFSREMASAGQLGMELTEEDRLEITREYIRENLKQIETWAEDTAEAEGFDYPVKAQLGVTWIPERNYDGIYFPAGNYEALNLVIGAGEGKNWWCVIFPPLCLIEGSEEVKKEIGEGRLDAFLASLGGDRIVLRSRILELLEEY